MAGVNAFSSQTREIVCGSVTSTGQSGKDEASAVFDTAIALVTIFHIIDWIRWTLLLTSALVSVNLLPLFYLLTVINLPFGIISCLVALATRYGEDGTACAEEGKQASRAFFLGLQIVCLVLYLPTFLIHIVYFRIRGVGWCHEQYIHEDEEDD